jgi:hypothetical protein
VGQRVHVDAIDAVERRMIAEVAAHDDRLGQVRRLRRGLGELRRELAEDRVRAALADEPERRHVPERRRAAVAENDLPTVRQREQLPQPAADGTDEVLDRPLAVRCPDDRSPGGDERLQLLGADLARAAAEPSVAREQVVRDANRAGIGAGHCASMAAPSSPTNVVSRDRSPRNRPKGPS